MEWFGVMERWPFNVEHRALLAFDVVLILREPVTILSFDLYFLLIWHPKKSKLVIGS